MTDREVMQQALEALGKVSARRVIMGSTGDYRAGQQDALTATSEDVEPAITALKAALEQPEQEPVAWCTKSDLENMAKGFSQDVSARSMRVPQLYPKESTVLLYTTPLAAQTEREPETRAKWNKGIRDSVDALLAQAGYQPDSSARHQLAMMNFDTPPTAHPEQEPVASIYVTTGGERVFDDWHCPLPAGRNLLYTTPPAAQQRKPPTASRRTQ